MTKAPDPSPGVARRPAAPAGPGPVQIFGVAGIPEIAREPTWPG